MIKGVLKNFANSDAGILLVNSTEFLRTSFIKQVRWLLLSSDTHKNALLEANRFRCNLRMTALNRVVKNALKIITALGKIFLRNW